MDKIAEGVEDTKIMASELGLDIDFKRFRKGNHKYLELNNLTSGLIERYYLTIQRKIISSLSSEGLVKSSDKDIIGALITLVSKLSDGLLKFSSI